MKIHAELHNTYHVKNHWFAAPFGSKLRAVKWKPVTMTIRSGNIGKHSFFALHSRTAEKLPFAEFGIYLKTLENVVKQSISDSARQLSVRSPGSQDPRAPRSNVKETTETVGYPYVCTLDSSPRGEPQRVERFSFAELGI